MSQAGSTGQPARCTLILLAGASGSGKSRLAESARCPRLNLDDFYHDGDHPAMPHTLGIVDWDHPDSWDAASAVAAVVALCRTGSADVPVYDITQNRRTGRHRVTLDGGGVLIAEGVFAPEIVGRCRDAGVPMEALYLDRSRTGSLVRRFLRDVREHRKPVLVLVRRGWALWREERRSRAHALALGCRPVSMAAALQVVRAAQHTRVPVDDPR